MANFRFHIHHTIGCDFSIESVQKVRIEPAQLTLYVLLQSIEDAMWLAKVGDA